MSARPPRLANVAIWVLLAATSSGCASQEAERYSARETPRRRAYSDRVGSAYVVVPEGAPPESLRWAVEASLSERHWSIDSRSPGRIQASVQSHGSGEHATIAVTYGREGIYVTQIAAAVNPARYDRWVRLLVANLNNHVSQIGMGRMAAPWAAPPPAAEPPPPAAPLPPASEP